MKALSLLIVCFFFLGSCATAKKKETLPGCILTKIEELKSKNDNSAFVYQYTNHGQIVYLISPGCCDMFEELYDEECNYICAPSGGFTGKGDGKCRDLDLQNEKVIWEPSNSQE